MKPSRIVTARPLPQARPLPVERARELLGAEAEGLSDEQVREVAYVVSRHVAAAFEIATREAR